MSPSRADNARVFHAPDGIAILPFDLPEMAHLSFVEGRIPPRPEPYPVHLHGALEQVTYVLAGEITVETWDAEHGMVAAFTACPGDAFVTLPLQTLAFANHGVEEARVLFACAPAYPPDDRDTRLVDAHRAPNADDRAWSRGRHMAAIEAFAIVAERRGAMSNEVCIAPHIARCSLLIAYFVALVSRVRAARFGVPTRAVAFGVAIFAAMAGSVNG